MLLKSASSVSSERISISKNNSLPNRNRQFQRQWKEEKSHRRHPKTAEKQKSIGKSGGGWCECVGGCWSIFECVVRLAVLYTLCSSFGSPNATEGKPIYLMRVHFVLCFLSMFVGVLVCVCVLFLNPCWFSAVRVSRMWNRNIFIISWLRVKYKKKKKKKPLWKKLWV